LPKSTHSSEKATPPGNPYLPLEIQKPANPAPKPLESQILSDQFTATQPPEIPAENSLDQTSDLQTKSNREITRKSTVKKCRDWTSAIKELVNGFRYIYTCPTAYLGRKILTKAKSRQNQ